MDQIPAEKQTTKKPELSPDEKEMLINTINKKGFFLEEKAYGILEQRQGLFELRKNFIPKNYNLKFSNDRIEIDLIFTYDYHNLIIECKKTDFAWVFPKSLVGNNNTNFIYEYEDGMRIKSFDLKNLKVCCSEPMEIMIDKDGKLVQDKNNKDKKFVKTQSRQEDPIQRAIMRVLRQIKAWRWEPESVNNLVNPPRHRPFFIPIILTNAPLLYLDYDTKNIDKNSSLTDYTSLEEVKAVVYNYPEFLDWPNAKEEKEIKSIFIVNINYFSEFLDWILAQDLSILSGVRKVVNLPSFP